MSRRAWWLIVVATITALPLAAVGTGVAMLDPDSYKPEVVRAVQAKTGRTLTLNGPLRISRSLWPTIEVNDVTLANLPGGTRPDMARAERIEAQLSLPALLWRRIEVVKLTLVGPNILFEEVGGQPNWVFSRPEGANEAPAAAPGSPFSLRIRNAHVQNGMVTTRLPARTRVVGIRSLDLRHAADGGPLNLTAVLVYSDNQPFRLQVSAQPTAEMAGPWTTQLEFAAFDTTASAGGTMDVAGNYDLQIEAKAGALEKLNALLPEMDLPALHGVDLSTHLTNGPVLGDLPVVGATTLRFADADGSDRLPGLRLGATTVSFPAAGAPATVAGSGRYAGQAFTINGTFGVPGRLDGRVTLPVDLHARAASGKGNAAGAGEGSLALNGKLILNALRFDGLDATAALRTPALAAFRPVLAHALPALKDVQFAGRLIVPANAGSIAFKGAKLLTHAGDIAGDGTVGLGPGVALDAKLRSARLDIDALLEAIGIGPTARPAPGSPTGPMISDAPLPWAALRGPALNVSGSISATTFHDQAWQNVSFTLQLKDGRLQVSPLRAAHPGGPLEFSMTVDAAASPVPVSVDLNAPAMPLALVARYADLPGSIVGTLRIDAQLHGTGQSVHEVAASLDGPLSATVIGGRLSNAAFIKLTSGSLAALGIKVPAEGETELRCFGLEGLFSHGIGRFRTIALDTTHLQLDGLGQVDLRQETVALKLHPLAQVSGSAVSVPVLVEGPFRAIRGRLDASGLDKLGLLIDALFGGDHPDTCSEAGLVPSQGSRR